jgi:hypothetical protein
LSAGKPHRTRAPRGRVVRGPAKAAVYDRLRAGEITANAASVEAGLRKSVIQVSADPDRK